MEAPDLATLRADPALAALEAHAARHLDDDPGHNLAHALRVARVAIRLAASLGACPREAFAAALLHDLVNVPKDHPDRALASTRSAEAARALLPDFGCDAAGIDRVAAAIADHSFSRGVVPSHPLGQALQDADRLEALGAIGLFRCISTGVRMGAAYFHDADPFARSRSLDDRAFSIDHFYTKLLRLPASFLTPAGRAEAERRAAFLQATLAQLGEELGEAPRET